MKIKDANIVIDEEKMSRVVSILRNFCLYKGMGHENVYHKASGFTYCLEELGVMSSFERMQYLKTLNSVTENDPRIFGEKNEE